MLEDAPVKPMKKKETGLTNAKNDDGWELTRKTPPPNNRLSFLLNLL